MIGLDTNLLVRYVVQDDLEQAARAARLIEDRCTVAEPGFINDIVLCELVWVLESVYRLGRDEVAGILDRVLRVPALEVEDFDRALGALQHYRSGTCDFSDALIGLKNRRHGCIATATFDRRAGRLAEFMAVP